MTGAAAWWCSCGSLMRCQPDRTFACPHCDTPRKPKPKPSKEPRP